MAGLLHSETVATLREFYRQLCDIHFNRDDDVIGNVLYSITTTKSDVQASLFQLLMSVYADKGDRVKDCIDLDELWTQTRALCHSSQPIQLNTGALFCSFLSMKCDIVPLLMGAPLMMSLQQIPARCSEHR